MELLLSNFKPGKFSGIKSAKDFFESNLEKVDLIKIATGYISSDSLIELKKIIEINKRPRIDMLIGMHYFEGFTKTQYNAAKSLHEYLKDSDLGSLSLSNTVKFHGKMYSFVKDDKPVNSIIGSSNFSSIYSSNDRLYEADVLFSDKADTLNIDNYISQIITTIGSPFDNVSVTEFKEFNSLLENHYGVKKLDSAELTEVWNTKGTTEFELPIKTEEKSNLNVFFGKGRVSPRGFEKPRPWYEVEFIVGKKITSLPGYPASRSFKVVTDDGWAFQCVTNGDFSKNFRSADDLKILGKWIKGRLEIAGALQIGQPVTEDVLRTYGRDTLKLSSTNNPDVWLLDFKH